MTYDEAKRHVIPFGKHRLKRVEVIAETDEGLLYLDWLRGDMHENKAKTQDWQKPTLEALDAYLSAPAIQKDLSRAMESKKRKRTGGSWAERQRQMEFGL